MVRFFKDTSLSMLSNLLLVLCLQLLLYPAINADVGAESFGIFLSSIALINLLSLALGSSFSNLYLRNYNQYKNIGVDYSAFKVYIKILNVISVVLILLLTIIGKVYGITYPLLIILGLICLLMTNRLFIISRLRAKLNYRKIFLSNLFLSLFYGLFSLFNYSTHFSVFFSFLVIELLTMLVLLYLVKEETMTYTKKIFSYRKFDFKGLLHLLISVFSTNATNYFDRWLILILLKPVLIPVFYAASISIKIFAQPLNVLSSVILSYVANTDNINKKNKRILLTITPLLSILTFIFGFFLGPILIKIVYPQYYNSAMEIFWIINLALSLTVIDFIFRGYLLKFYPLAIKMTLDLLNLFLFVVLSLIFTSYFKSLYGIAYAKLISFAIKTVIQYVFILKLRTSNNN